MCLLIVQIYVSRLMTKPTKWHVRPAKTQSDPSLRSPHEVATH